VCHVGHYDLGNLVAKWGKFKVILAEINCI
jgi:hypothetical protein